ncbi:MAG: coenzyme F420-0:L-glutamate ligase [Bacillota bacterium]|jgi:F420-0:gamma-glutamyl ligase-like protein|nr:coenzyme F420-0:L-glutamate ligase [Bacillota bacterium]
MVMEGLVMKANPGKRLEMRIGENIYMRIPVRTKVISATDEIAEVAKEYIGGLLQPADVVVVSEKAVAITQGRFYHVDEIKPSWLARLLSKFVYNSPHGANLRCPKAMELAIREVGWLRVLVAALIGGLGKLFGIRGLFYRICGTKARSVDGAWEGTIPPYQRCIVLAPENPEKVAEQLKEALGCEAAVIDANDLGVNILGASSGVDQALLLELLRDNPLGQSTEQTPFGIIRRVPEEELEGFSAS